MTKSTRVPEETESYGGPLERQDKLRARLSWPEKVRRLASRTSPAVSLYF